MREYVIYGTRQYKIYTHAESREDALELVSKASLDAWEPSEICGEEIIIKEVFEL